MALPKRLRDQMAAEGKTLDDVTREVKDKVGNFGLNEAIANNAVPTPLDADDDELDPLDFVQTATNATDPTDPTDPTDQTDVSDPTDQTDASDPTDGTDPADPTDGRPDTPAEARGDYINPFDVDFVDDDPASVAQPEPAPAPVPQAAQPAPAPSQPAPAPQEQFKLTPEEIRALGGPQQAQLLMNIMQRFNAPQQAHTQNQIMEARRTAFRTGIATSVPQYREIITSRSWKKYLGTYSPLAGGTIADALLAADHRLDSQAVLGIFEDFRSKFAKANPAKPSDAGKGGTTRPKPADLATPGKSATNNGGVKPSGKRYKFKESDIAKFDDLRRRKKMSAPDYQEQVAKYEQALVAGEVELGA